MAANLPGDIIVDILSRLPVNDLVRFRSVCKAWRHLMDGPDFIKLHLNRTAETRIVFGGLPELYWVDPKALDSPQRLSFPMDIGKGINMLGGCNGLIAVANVNGGTAIWNPSTRRHISLPPLVHPPVVAFFEVSLLGFGYDPIGDDYKLLRLVVYRCYGKPNFFEVDVYSLRAKAWRRIRDFPGHFNYDRHGEGVLVHNALHWFVTRVSDSTDSLLAFDLATEVPREVQMPDHADVKAFKNPCMGMANLGGCLCISMLGDFNAAFRRSERIDVWVMKEYGVRESWTKIFSVGPSSATASFRFAIPVMYLEDGDRVLMNWDGERFVVYDLKKKRIEKVKGPNVPRIVDTHVCTRSLVRVDGGGVQRAKKESGESKKKGGKRKQKASGNKERDDFLSKGFKLVL